MGQKNSIRIQFASEPERPNTLYSKTVQEAIEEVRGKRGVIPPASFAGNPKTFDVIFASPFVDVSYTVSVTSSDQRIWSVINKTVNGFLLSANANQALTGDVYWAAV